jgi:predicted nucleotidyltransferase
VANDFKRTIDALVDHQVDFVIVGGVALVVHGSARTTEDVDICYSRELRNLEALAAALAPHHPTLRGAPGDLPFRLDAATLRMGLNFTLDTDLGAVDLLGELTGVGRYNDLVGDAQVVELYGRRVKVMSLDALERAKRAAGRLKDLADLAEILEIRRRTPT